MVLEINDDKLKCSDLQEVSTKVRAILIDEHSQILIANYHNVILLPGGKVDEGESLLGAMTRELSEEIGQDYSEEELQFLVTLNYFQKNYPRGNGIFKNRLVQTHYFVGKYKDINWGMQKLTEKEQKGNFHLELVPLDSLENVILNNKSTNPRNQYFQKELLNILELYKNSNTNVSVKKIKM